MQFRVPQFIDMEDKVVGPLTFKQFGYILGAAGFSFLIWTFMPIKIIAMILILAVSGLFLALAFIKINNRPFGDILESAFSYYTGGKVYIWKQPTQESIKNTAESDSIKKIVEDTTKEIAISRANKGSLHELSLGLDVFEREQNIAEKENIDTTVK